MLHPEALLLVDHRETQPREGCSSLHESRSADYQDRTLIVHPCGGISALTLRHASRQEERTDSQWSQELRQRSMVLLGKKLGRRHDCRLVTVLHRKETSKESDNGLSAPDIALKQAVHPPIAAHVAEDLAHRSLLAGGELEWKRVAECGRKLAAIDERDTAARFAGDPVRPALKEVDEKKLLVCEPVPPALRLGD